MAGEISNVPPRGPFVNTPRSNAQFDRDQNNGRKSEMKTGLLQLLYQNPFTGLDHENPFTHLTKFYEIGGTIAALEAEEEQVFKRLFPYSLIGKAKEWYLDQPNNVMTSWNELEEKFLDRFFPHNRFLEAKTSISAFSQGQSEALNEAWERNGLQPQPKTLLDATAGGSLMSKSAEEAVAFIDRMALNYHQGQHNCSTLQRKPGVLELNMNNAILSQNKLLTQQV
ncbi:uncharacterized protein LOC131604330 [Vicia villosa]|uniref:uncharacterized protein LOC131604330 n=1 Tax=Vicia villosa TaxID=3911 RepID=UPI00273B9348|nr:uncharacterized protein LOC131604330 [Vicia villosa]